MARVLIGCEESQVVCCAFRELGIEAFSCDILPSSGGHPEWHIQDDVFNVLEREHWDLAIIHPPCFGENTLITTINGLKPIRDIVIGDMVLTHNGRYRRVESTMRKTSDHYRVLKSSNNTETITTDNHPFFVRRRLRRKDTDPSFVNCAILDRSYFTGSVFSKNDTDCDYTDETLFLMGRYVADGYLRSSRYSNDGYEDMILCIGYNKFEFFESRVTSTNYSARAERTAVKVHFYKRDFCQLFEQFGKGASNKTIPQWVIDLPKNRLRFFLEGYLSGDGNISGNRLSCSTVSEKLAIQIGNVLSKVYEKPYSIFRAKERDVKIEGRDVHCNPLYSVSISIIASHKQNYFEDNSSWGRVLRNERIGSKMEVFNLSVEEDNSYVANGVMVHNCTFLSVSGAQWYYHPDDKNLPVENRRSHPKYPDRAKDREEAADFFMRCMNAPVERIAIENPVGIMSSRFRKPDQIIQPFMFGDEARKTTCLWLKNLPKLEPTNIVGEGERVYFKSGKSHPKWYADALSKSKSKEERRTMRSKTFLGIARAMAAQWSKVLNTPAERQINYDDFINRNLFK